MNSSSSAVASSSSPSPPLSIIPLQKYDVFISFRGPDTRNDFTSHLYAALCRKQICTFIDDGLPKGDPISTLFPIIESSKFSVIIFSQHYASSKWCLNELVKILECRKTRGQRVIPVFYNVDPSNVKNQTGSYAKSFAEKHEGKQTPEIIQIWRNALREAARLVGWNTADTRPDALLTEKIVEDIWKKLNHMSSSYNKNLVGIDSKVKVIESMLSLGSMDLCVVGIYGIGGIGKTTLAQATLDKILIEFQDAYFIDNIREKSTRVDGLSNLRKDLFFSLSGAIAKTCYISDFTLARFCKKKIVIVFDDVSDPMQVEEIVGPLQNWDNTGSRFIVTSRDKQVLQNLCDGGKAYKLSGLFDDEALQLFSRYAFKQEFLIEKHMDLSKKVVKYTGGVPLALKVLASYLCGRSEKEWKSALEKLEEIPHVKIQDVLKISYDGLEEDQKKLFLDIACFFQEKSRGFLVEYFSGCGFKAEIELAILIDKCLIEIKSLYCVITMHDMIRRMGREIVRQESNDDPSKRSRLWHHEDIKQVLRRNTGTEVIKGISLDMSMIDDINLENDAFEKMKNLRLLNFYGPNKVHMPWGLDSILNELRYLRWDGFPLKSLQPNFNLANLVQLHIEESNIKQLWGGGQPLFNLRTMNLFLCEELTAIPNPFEAQNLQELNICICESLDSIPSWAHLKFLTHLVIGDCPKLEIIPELPSNLDTLLLSAIAIEDLPSSIGHLSRLRTLSITSCPKLKSLPDDIRKLTSLDSFYIDKCKKLKRLPHDLGDLEALVKLSIRETTIEVLPSSICKLKSLYRLEVSNNKKLVRLPHDIGDLKSLQRLFACNTAIEELPSSICKLKSLDELEVSGNRKLARLPQNIGDLKSLKSLDAFDTAIEELPSSIGHLPALLTLKLCGAKLKCLPTCILYLKSLEYLRLCGIEELRTLPHDLVNLGDLETSNFSEPSKAKFFSFKRFFLPCCYGRPAIFHEDIGNLKPLMEESPIGLLYDARLNCFPRNISKLKSLVQLCPFSTIDRLRSNLEAFPILDVSVTSIEEMPSSLSYPGKIKCLSLRNCGIQQFPSNFGQLNFLGELNLSCNKFENLPESIIDLSQLKSLKLLYCHRLQALPELPRKLYFLDASGCSSLKTVPSSSILFATFETCYPKSTILVGCHKLDKDSIRVVTEYALLKPQLKVMASQHDDLSKFQGYCIKNQREAYVIYPGSKIPEWFNSQSVGSLITLEHPLRSHNRKIAGIAICVVVNLPCSEIGFYYKIEQEHGKSNVGTYTLLPLHYFKLESLHTSSGYHVCIMYVPCTKSLPQLKSDTISFGFYVERKKSLEKTVTCFDVEACGVRFLYGQNLRKRNRGFSSVDEELGSPHKRVRDCTDEDYTESFSMIANSLSSLKIS